MAGQHHPEKTRVTVNLGAHHATQCVVPQHGTPVSVTEGAAQHLTGPMP